MNAASPVVYRPPDAVQLTGTLVTGTWDLPVQAAVVNAVESFREYKRVGSNGVVYRIQLKPPYPWQMPDFFPTRPTVRRGVRTVGAAPGSRGT